MFLSDREKERRYRSVRVRMAEHNLDSLILRGSSAIRGEGAGFRFLTDFPNINIPLVLVFFQKEESPPIMLVESRLQEMRARKYSWIADVRLSADFLESLLAIVAEKKLTRGQVGTDGLDKFPLAWHRKIKHAFPDFSLLDFAQPLKELRAYRTAEEIPLVKKSAALVDLAFTEGIRQLKPGKTEWEIMAYMDFVLKSHGVEKSFNIISQGTKVDAYAATGRKIRNKGMVFLELTANYGGYWTQLARAVSVGKPDATLMRLHRASVEAIQECLRYLKPGFAVAKPMKAMEEHLRKSGLDCTPVYGHIVGIDMIEDRPSPQSEIEIMPGMVFIVHPWPVLARHSLVWGETYLITAKGNQRLNRVGDELLVL